MKFLFISQQADSAICPFAHVDMEAEDKVEEMSIHLLDARLREKVDYDFVATKVDGEGNEWTLLRGKGYAFKLLGRGPGIITLIPELFESALTQAKHQHLPEGTYTGTVKDKLVRLASYSKIESFEETARENPNYVAYAKLSDANQFTEYTNQVGGYIDQFVNERKMANEKVKYYLNRCYLLGELTKEQLDGKVFGIVGKPMKGSKSHLLWAPTDDLVTLLDSLGDCKITNDIKQFLTMQTATDERNTTMADSFSAFAETLDLINTSIQRFLLNNSVFLQNVLTVDKNSVLSFKFILFTEGMSVLTSNPARYVYPKTLLGWTPQLQQVVWFMKENAPESYNDLVQIAFPSIIIEEITK